MWMGRGVGVGVGEGEGEGTAPMTPQRTVALRDNHSRVPHGVAGQLLRRRGRRIKVIEGHRRRHHHILWQPGRRCARLYLQSWTFVQTRLILWQR